jgi:hypothetical protein
LPSGESRGSLPEVISVGDDPLPASAKIVPPAL